MTASNGADAWQHLGARLIQRRTALDPRFHNRSAFCEATGLNYRLVYDIEEARRTNFGNSALAAIEAAYRLEPDSITRFLGGGELEPQPAPSRPAAFPPIPPPSRLVFDDETEEAKAVYLAEVKRRVELARRKYPGRDLAGWMVFPLDPRAAESWDQLLKAKWPQDFVEQGIATMLASAEQAARNERDDGIAAVLLRGYSAESVSHVTPRPQCAHSRGNLLSMLR